MKPFIRYTLLLLCMVFFTETAFATNRERQKQTYTYAVDGCDTLRLDHYVAPVEGARPCMMFLFGGGFSGGVRDNSMNVLYFEFLADNGYDVVSIDYRLGMKGVNSPGLFKFLRAMEHSVEIAAEDLFRATNFIIDRADEWHIDIEKIVISGSSAGAIAVLQGEYILSNRLPLSEILPADFHYAGVISFAGAVFSLKGTPRWPSSAAPMLLFHGSADTQVPYKKVALLGYGMYGSKYIAKRLRKAGAPYWFYSVEYATHSMAGTPMHENRDEILMFLEEFVLGKSHQQRTTHIIDKSIPKRRTFFLPTDYISSNY